MKPVHCIVLAGAVLMIAGCTTYYQVREPAGQKACYTTEVEQTREGAVKFKDARSGLIVLR